MSVATDSLAGRILTGLAAAGVDTVFGLPGVHNLAFWRETGPDLPRILGVRHEQTTVYAADGLARATGGLGVALTTTGPGAANAVGAFGEAARSGSPVLLIASEISTALARPGVLRGVLHESRDQAGMFEPLAKAVYRPRTAAAAVEALAEAIDVAMTCPRGPVYLDVPTDVLAQPAPPCGIGQPPPVIPDGADLDALAAEVDAADRVVLWAGGGAVQAGAGDDLGRLAEVLGAPVVTTYAARGILPPRHPWLIGLPPHEPEVATLIGAADLLLAVGTGFDANATRNWTMPRPPRLAVVNCDPGELAKNYPADVAVLGDAGLSLRGLLDRVAPRTGANPVAELRRTAWARLRADPANAVPLALLDAVRRAIDPTTVVIADMAVAGYWYGGYGEVAGPRRLQYPIGWGTLGYALPAAVGAATAGPVLAICGDGGLMLALGELATVAQERLPVTVLVVDDGGYGMLRYDQDHAGDPHRGVDLLAADWVALGAAFGLPVRVVEDIGTGLEPALRPAGPGIVVVRAAMIPPRTTSPRWSE